MSSKIDVRVILKDHFLTLRDEATSRLSYIDIVVMFGIPALFAVASISVRAGVNDSYVGTIVSMFSIFAGLLFNVLVLIYSLSPQDEVPSDQKGEIRRRLLKQAFSNISYSILIALAVVVILGLSLFVGGWIEILLGALAIFLAVNFGLSLLMVLKRLHMLLRDRFTA